MSAGIYVNNGVYAYAMDLEKKLRRRKSATIVEEYQGDLTGKDLEVELQKIVDKYNNNKPQKEPIAKSNTLKYHWKNKINGYTLHSIYPEISHIPNIKLDEWEPYDPN